MAKTYGAVLVGLEPQLVEVETIVGAGFSGLNILGLPSEVARDMRERVRAVLEQVGLPIPARRLIVNVSPSEAMKLARSPLTELDFAVAACTALALLESQARETVSQMMPTLFGGELTLGGELRPLKCPLVYEALCHQNRSFLGRTALPVGSQNGSGYKTFAEWVATLTSSSPPLFVPSVGDEKRAVVSKEERVRSVECFISELCRTPKLLVACLAAAAGRHHLLLAGEPGVGKSFALSRIGEILPPLASSEDLQLRLIYEDLTLKGRPVRSPHHSATSAALLGGASLRPGEVTFAHRGVLFLDELTEFSRTALEALREPLDSGRIHLSRASGRVSYPADFQFCAATNPCPCGFLFSKRRACRCGPTVIRQTLGKLSGPLLDRFSLQVWVGEGADDLFTQEMRKILANPTLIKEFAQHFLRVQDHCFFQREGVATLQEEVREALKLSRRGERALLEVSQTFGELFASLRQSDEFLNAVKGYRELEGKFCEVPF